MATTLEMLDDLISMRPGKTERELAEVLWPRKGYQQRVNQDCRELIRLRKVERRGPGGPGDPFRYYPMRRR
jgi:hypothetical protein